MKLHGLFSVKLLPTILTSLASPRPDSGARGRSPRGDGDLGDCRRPPGRHLPGGRAAACLGLVSMTVGAARKEMSEGLLVRVLGDWDMGELHAVFPACKVAKPSACAFVDLLASSTVMIFPSGSQLRSDFPRDQRMALIDPRAPS
jgi:hypothetical protein